MEPGRLSPGSPLEPLCVMTRNRPALRHPGSAELVRRAPSLARTGLGLLGTAVGIGLAVGAGLGRGAEERLEPGEVARSLSESYVDVAARVAPAVVRIEAFAVAGGMERPLGQGSGVILSEDGLIATNAHVVRRASRVRVSLVDGRAEDARVVGLDVDTDLAVLRIEAEGLVSAPLRADEEARVGEWVLAIGNPLGLDHAVTAGIVSGRGRSASIAAYEDFIQTDAAINPGNSGGPLVDLEGRVIGINTAVANPASGGQGIGFAIPARMVDDVVTELAASGRVTRGYMGVQLNEFSDEYASARGYRGASRVVVARAEPGTPASVAGVESGEIIDALDGVPVGSLRAFMASIARLRPGTVVELALVRGRDRRTVELKLAERPNPSSDR